jgi:hypothetical protein
MAEAPGAGPNSLLALGPGGTAADRWLPGAPDYGAFHSPAGATFQGQAQYLALAPQGGSVPASMQNLGWPRPAVAASCEQQAYALLQLWHQQQHQQQQEQQRQLSARAMPSAHQGGLPTTSAPRQLSGPQPLGPPPRQGSQLGQRPNPPRTRGRPPVNPTYSKTYKAVKAYRER